MINPKSRSLEWITEAARQIGVRDIALVEKTIRAFSLYANLDENCIPREIINMDVADYHSFLEARRKLMAQKVKAYFNAL